MGASAACELARNKRAPIAAAEPDSEAERIWRRSRRSFLAFRISVLPIATARLISRSKPLAALGLAIGMKCVTVSYESSGRRPCHTADRGRKAHHRLWRHAHP